MMPSSQLQHEILEVNKFTKLSMNRPRMTELNEETESTVYYAIQKDEVQKLQVLLDQGFSPNYCFYGTDPLGRGLRWTLLQLCAEKGSIGCGKALLEAGADTEGYDRWGETALMYSVCCGWLNMAELLLKYDCDIDARDNKGWSALHYAAELEHPGATTLLLRKGADVNALDEYRRSPLWYAVRQDGRLPIIKLLIENGAAINDRDGRDSRTPLQGAIWNAKEHRLQYIHVLLAAGADVNIRDRGLHNSMLNVIHRTRTVSNELTREEMDIVELLILAGYKLNETPTTKCWYEYSGTPLKMAAERGALNLIKFLVQNGADFERPDGYNLSPLHMAAFHGHLHIVRYLCQLNCRLQEVGDIKFNNTMQKATPLKCAILKGHWEIAEFLLDIGHTLQHEDYLSTNEGVPECLVLNCDFWNFLNQYAMTVPTLLVLGQRRIRLKLGTGIAEKVETLPLPRSMKDLLLLKEMCDT